MIVLYYLISLNCLVTHIIAIQHTLFITECVTNVVYTSIPQVNGITHSSPPPSLTDEGAEDTQMSKGREGQAPDAA